MKPNFEQMSITELRAYVLAHRQDNEAIYALFHHPSLNWVTTPPLFTQDGQAIPENIHQAEESLRQHLQQDHS